MRPDSKYVCDVLSDWARGFVDRDGKFVREFQTSFNSAFWELYVHAVLKKYGMSVDFSVDRPDFLVREPTFSVEAGVALNAQDSVPEHDQSPRDVPEDLNELNRVAILRLSNTISSKLRKFRSEYSLLAHVRGKPFVLALASFEQRYSYLGAQRPIEAILLGNYVNEERYIKSGRPGGVLTDEPMESISKREGVEIDLGLFCGPACPEISAVMFNACANFGKARALSADPERRSFFTSFRQNIHGDTPHVVQGRLGEYSETLIDGLRIYHNPFAYHPLDPAHFRHPSVFQVYVRDDEVVAEQREGQLLNRFTRSILSGSQLP
jgi:hypothetical protein